MSNSIGLNSVLVMLFVMYSCTASSQLPLFKAYPDLQINLSHVSLGDFPTPIIRLQKLENTLSCRTSLYIKRDDLTGMKHLDMRLFGGNKVRKLEFLLADAKRNGARGVFTYGCVGSNHVAATSEYCKQLGLACKALLKSQPASWVVQRNLLLMHEYGAEILFFDTNMERTYHGIELRHAGSQWYEIPTGGSSPLGIIGYVNAVFELRDQIRAGLMPEPHYIYVAAGSLGTITGLLLGIKAANLSTKVIGIAVEPDIKINQIRTLFNRANIILMQNDPTFPCCDIQNSDIHVRFDFSGPAYGESTKEAGSAITRMNEVEHIILDPTYTGKAFAALLHDVENGCLDERVVLFWNTFCSYAQPKCADISRLPRAVQEYALSTST